MPGTEKGGKDRSCSVQPASVPSRRRYFVFPTLMLVGGLALVGCGSSSTASSSQAAAPPAQTATSTDTLSGAALDKAFVDGMVPHHQAAVDMAKVELQKGQDPQVKALAQTIADSQTKEIGQMRSIAQRIGAPTPQMEWSTPMGTVMGIPISMVMSRMGTMVASAPNTDRAFLQMMIPHHASAITMANEESKNGGDQQLKTLGQSIVSSQAKEIGEMQQLMASGT